MLLKTKNSRFIKEIKSLNYDDNKLALPYGHAPNNTLKC